MNADVKKLRERLADIAHLSAVAAVLNWDQEVMMPKKAADFRAQSVAALAGVLHAKFVAIDDDGLLTGLKALLDAKKLRGGDAVTVSETWRSFVREKKLPEKFVKEMAEVTSKAQTVWAEARASNDFKLFLPHLSRIVKLKRQEAEFVGYKVSPYDALLDSYEPDMATEDASRVLEDLKAFLVPFVKKIAASKKKISAKALKGNFPLEKQAAFNAYVASAIGFDFEAGRLDGSTHPFSTSFSPNDCRITTRYKKDDVMYAIGSTVHEAGHAMYEQGLPAAHFGTPLSQSVSLGIHESQSRMWENAVGKSREFWSYFYSKLKKAFPVPFGKLSLDGFYTAINAVKPSLVRTEADEATYNLHIILRFEIEREMIEGSIDLKDLPKIWDAKFQEYFGMKPPSDSLGVLQDVHWSCGYIGYFPTYSLGNLYAAQFYAAMEREIPDVKKKIAKGDFAPVKAWLNKNIHAHGKTYSADALVRKVTGEPLTSAYFTDYLQKKYGEIYGLKA